MHALVAALLDRNAIGKILGELGRAPIHLNILISADIVLAVLCMIEFVNILLGRIVVVNTEAQSESPKFEYTSS